MIYKLITRSLVVAALSSNAWSTEFSLPVGHDALVGGIQYTKVSVQDTPTTVAQRYNLGLNAVVAANPGTTELRLSSTKLKIPTAFLLPPIPRQGIIINLPEMRLYFFTSNNEVMTFPIGIGKIGQTIPIRNTTIARKKMNPTWIPGPNVRKFNEEQGIDLPHSMGPGPDNPLGPYAIYLNIPSFLIHSTIFPESIGRRASFGCIRMNESDIKEFFPLVTPGTSVTILNMPFKAGWNGNKLFFEAHPPLSEHGEEYSATVDGAVAAVQMVLPKNAMTIVDWQLVAHLATQPDGVPHEIGTKVE